MDNSLTPSRTIRLADKDYHLDGSFGGLRRVQEAFNRDIVLILCDIMDMRSDDVAELISLASGGDIDVIGTAILDMGIMGNDYVVLKTELLAWLNIAVSPKKDREKKSAEMSELILKMSASHGLITKDLPSAPLDGNPQNSGEVTSGS